MKIRKLSNGHHVLLVRNPDYTYTLYPLFASMTMSAFLEDGRDNDEKMLAVCYEACIRNLMRGVGDVILKGDNRRVL